MKSPLNKWIEQLSQGHLPHRWKGYFSAIASAAVITELNEFLERANNNVDHPLNSNIFRRVGSAWVPLLA
jgi:hypothetical protein